MRFMQCDNTCRFFILPVALALFAAGCSGNKTEDGTQNQQEVERLREENRQLPQLRADSQEVQKLRDQTREIHKLRGEYQEVLRLRKDNEQLRNQLAKTPSGRAGATASAQAAQAASVAPDKPPPIANIVQAFEEAALALEGQEIKEQDKPLEGDRIMVDTNAMSLLMPDLNATNPGPYEVSGWLKSRGVRLKNYQQFNGLGITNYHIQRADPEPPK